jgi:uncharacterized protein (TIGR02284 family)
MATATTSALDTLNSLLRGEIAATETYQQALAKVGGDPNAPDPDAPELQRIHREHREAANTLRQHVRHYGGKPDQGSGVWGAFAKAVEGLAKIFGNTAALSALKDGEEHGVSSYEQALEDESLPAECKTLISGTLLPQTREHINTLDRLMSR